MEHLRHLCGAGGCDPKPAHSEEFLWASEMAPDTAASLPLSVSHMVPEASEKVTVFVRKLLQSSNSAMLNRREEFLS